MNTLPMNAFEASEGPLTAQFSPEVNVEETFGLSELFFSRTDTRGVIASYNDVFVRVAGFTGMELLGAPHKIIRHSDMPKAVFWLLWDGLKKNKPVAAYVKNKTKSGHYYWVLAIATPVDEGYLSIRMRPTSALPAQVAALYKGIRKAERDDALSAEQSAMLLLDKLYDLGFPTYASFQSHALATEFEARREKLKRPVNTDLENAKILAEHREILLEELSVLAEKFSHAGLLTANMKIFAAKLEVGRATINEIAKNYDLMLRDIQNNLSTLDVPDEPKDVWASTKEEDSFFMLCASELMTEMYNSFSAHKGLIDGVDRDVEMEHLKALHDKYQANSEKAVEYGMQSARAIQRRSDFLQRMILGLSTVRIACRVEAGMLRQHAKGLETIVARLDSFHEEVETHLTKVTLSVNAILKSFDQAELEAG